VPASHPLPHVHLSIARTGKPITLVGCIAADGSFLKPLVVIARQTYDTNLALTGITDEKVSLYSQSKRHIDRSIFLAWLNEIFLPEVRRRREGDNYTGWTVIIMDNCTAHTGDEIDELCELHGITVCPLPPHSSNQVQPLDLSTFGITKRLIAKVNRMETVNIQTSHIARVVSNFMSAASHLNNVGTFRSAGIARILGPNDILFCAVCPEHARCLFIPLDPIANLVGGDGGRRRPRWTGRSAPRARMRRWAAARISSEGIANSGGDDAAQCTGGDGARR
jgi:hypothetical protein